VLAVVFYLKKMSLPPPKRVQFFEAALWVSSWTEGHHHHAYLVVDVHFLYFWSAVFLFHVLKFNVCVMSSKERSNLLGQADCFVPLSQ
jgi:hypothetical protein